MHTLASAVFTTLSTFTTNTQLYSALFHLNSPDSNVPHTTIREIWKPIIPLTSQSDPLAVVVLVGLLGVKLIHCLCHLSSVLLLVVCGGAFAVGYIVSNGFNVLLWSCPDNEIPIEMIYN